MRAFGNRLEGTPCESYRSDLRVGVPNLPSHSYPDVSVICGPLQLDPRDKSGNTVTNPRLIVEILSPSTEIYDRGRKFKRYLQLESLEEYVLVSQDEARLELYLRRDDVTWLFSYVDGIDAVAKFGSLHIEVPLTEIYRTIEFPPNEYDLSSFTSTF